MALVLVAAAALVLGLVALMRSAVSVPDRHAYVVARLGRYQGTLEAGRHRIVPFVDTVVRRYSRDRDAVVLSARCTTRDGESVVIEGSLGFRVTDPRQAYLGAHDPALLASGLATGIAQRAI